jgi:acyl-CoA thioesterase-1
MNFKRRGLVIAGIASLLWAATGAAYAASVTVVALGTSNTRGRGVSPAQAYPAQLQMALKARGHNVRVINMGVNGASSAEVLANARSVSSGTALVLYEYAVENDRAKRVMDGGANMSALQAHLSARGIRSINVTGAFASQYRIAFQRGMLVSDYGPHLNPQAYAELVQSLLPEVEAALGR